MLSFYYPPDLSACSFRMRGLIDALRTELPAKVEADLISTQPNRYLSHRMRAPDTEKSGPINVRRISLPEHNSDIVGQCRAFASYARGASRIARDTRYDAVFATSSRLMTAALGARIARRLDVPLYLDIRDIFTDTIGDIFEGLAGKVAERVFSTLERRTMSRATHINLVSEGFRDHFVERYPSVPLSFFPNGIDEEFLAQSTPPSQQHAGAERLEILYAGNIGEGQCLHGVVPDLALRLEKRARITVIGDGGRRRQLESAVRAAGVTNVDLEPPMRREKLIERYNSADVLFLHLGAYAAFEKVLPSKIFEYAATGKPILAGVSGNSADFLRREVENSAVFAPGESNAAVAALDSLSMKPVRRTSFIEKYRRDAISRQLAASVIGMLEVG